MFCLAPGYTEEDDGTGGTQGTNNQPGDSSVWADFFFEANRFVALTQAPGLIYQSSDESGTNSVVEC